MLIIPHSSCAKACQQLIRCNPTAPVHGIVTTSRTLKKGRRVCRVSLSPASSTKHERLVELTVKWSYFLFRALVHSARLCMVAVQCAVRTIWKPSITSVCTVAVFTAFWATQRQACQPKHIHSISYYCTVITLCEWLCIMPELIHGVSYYCTVITLCE